MIKDLNTVKRSYIFKSKTGKNGWDIFSDIDNKLETSTTVLNTGEIVKFGTHVNRDFPTSQIAIKFCQKWFPNSAITIDTRG
jgi:hypothetical protein